MMTEDNMTQQGAHKLAAKIRAYWAQRKCAVTVWVVNESAQIREASKFAGMNQTFDNDIWGVRSDLGMALPPRLPAIAA